MKKLIFSLAAIVVMVSTVLVFSSCGSDSDSNNTSTNYIYFETGNADSSLDNLVLNFVKTKVGSLAQSVTIGNSPNGLITHAVVITSSSENATSIIKMLASVSNTEFESLCEGHCSFAGLYYSDNGYTVQLSYLDKSMIPFGTYANDDFKLVTTNNFDATHVGYTATLYYSDETIEGYVTYNTINNKMQFNSNDNVYSAVLEEVTSTSVVISSITMMSNKLLIHITEAAITLNKQE